MVIIGQRQLCSLVSLTGGNREDLKAQADEVRPTEDKKRPTEDEKSPTSCKAPALAGGVSEAQGAQGRKRGYT